MYKKIAITILSVSLIASVITGCSTKKAEKDIYTATVESDSFYITSETSGRIIELNMEQGKEIKEGDSLVKLDSKIYELQKAQAEAALKIAKAKQSELPDNAKDTLRDQAEAAVAQAQAAVDIAQLQIDRSSIKSFSNGIISEIFINRGEMVSPGMNIGKAINTKSKYIKVYVEESKRNNIKLGNSIDLMVNNKKVDSGKIVFISPISEFTPKNTETKSEKEKTLFEIKIALSENSSTVPGMMVDVKIE